MKTSATARRGGRRHRLPWARRCAPSWNAHARRRCAPERRLAAGFDGCRALVRRRCVGGGGGGFAGRDLRRGTETRRGVREIENPFLSTFQPLARENVARHRRWLSLNARRRLARTAHSVKPADCCVSSRPNTRSTACSTRRPARATRRLTNPSTAPRQTRTRPDRFRRRIHLNPPHPPGAARRRPCLLYTSPSPRDRG